VVLAHKNQSALVCPRRLPYESAPAGRDHVGHALVLKPLVEVLVPAEDQVDPGSLEDRVQEFERPQVTRGEIPA